MLITLVRHGEMQAAGRLNGRTDAALSAAGWLQLERATNGVAFGAIVTSPLQRARLPAEALAACRALPLRIDADWAELDFGDWDGKAVADLGADPATADALADIYRGADAAAPPGGESWAALAARVERAIHVLLAAHDADARVLVSTHAGPMRAALAVTCGIPFASLWAFRIGFGSRITLSAGHDANGRLWGEIVEVMQP